MFYCKSFAWKFLHLRLSDKIVKAICQRVARVQHVSRLEPFKSKGCWPVSVCDLQTWQHDEGWDPELLTKCPSFLVGAHDRLNSCHIMYFWMMWRSFTSSSKLKKYTISKFFYKFSNFSLEMQRIVLHAQIWSRNISNRPRALMGSHAPVLCIRRLSLICLQLVSICIGNSFMSTWSNIIPLSSLLNFSAFPPLLEKLHHALIQPHGLCSIVESIC